MEQGTRNIEHREELRQATGDIATKDDVFGWLRRQAYDGIQLVVDRIATENRRQGRESQEDGNTLGDGRALLAVPFFARCSRKGSIPGENRLHATNSCTC